MSLQNNATLPCLLPDYDPSQGCLSPQGHTFCRPHQQGLHTEGLHQTSHGPQGHTPHTAPSRQPRSPPLPPRTRHPFTAAHLQGYCPPPPSTARPGVLPALLPFMGVISLPTWLRFPPQCTPWTHPELSTLCHAGLSPGARAGNSTWVGSGSPMNPAVTAMRRGQQLGRSSGAAT